MVNNKLNASGRFFEVKLKGFRLYNLQLIRLSGFLMQINSSELMHWM